MASNRKMFLICLYPFLLFINLSLSLKIEVYNGSELLKTYNDRNAIYEGRSLGIDDEGFLEYTVPRNACTTLEASLYNIAFVSNYDDCPDDNIKNVQKAGYSTLLSYSPSSLSLPQSNNNIVISAVLIKDEWFANYLESLLNTSDFTITLEIYEDYWEFYEKIILIFCIVLMGAISLAICIFMCSFCTRVGFQKWRQRGLTRWRIRQLPQRRYNSSRETSQTCSICLDDFIDGEKLRVLPCGHVFHPKCVDEWLQKWRRNCPLCKSQISRRKQSERASLLPENSEDETMLTSYGAIEDPVRPLLQSNDDETTPPMVDENFEQR